MHTQILSTLCLTLAITPLALAPLAAQKMGSSNANAPTVSQSIQYTDGTTIKVSYFALATAKGSTLSQMLDKERGQGTRTRFNNNAKATPLGKLETTAEITLGGKKIAKGEYDLRITITDDLKWTMSLTPAGEAGEVGEAGEAGKAPVSFELSVADAASKHPCLQVSLTPRMGEQNGNLEFCYGTLHTTLELATKTANASGRRANRRRNG